MTTRPFRVGRRRIGPSEPPYVIAEAGVHHGNDVKLAKRYVTEARKAGADAIKFQTYVAGRIATTWAPAYWRGAAPGLKQYDVFKDRALLDEEDYGEVAAHARGEDIDFLSTPFHVEAVPLLKRLGVKALKVASADLTNLPLLRAAAKTRLPLFLSTGAATMAEVRATWKALPSPRPPVALLHCNLAYPTPVGQANLRRLALLARAVPQAVLGYSDHTIYDEAPAACPSAVALGARVIEKHFTLDKTLGGDDHYHAVDPKDLRRLVADCRDAFAMTGEPVETTPSEQPARRFARRSIVAAHDLPAGRVLAPDDIDFKRPGTGVSPMQVDRVLGRRLKRAKAQDELVEMRDLA